MKKKVFTAEIETLPTMLEWVRTQWTQCSVKSFSPLKIEVALEEALVNIIHYAYGKKSGKIEISMKIVPEIQMEIGIRDWGRSFNPLLQAPQVQLSNSIKEKKEGGLGIFFMMQLVDDLLYERDGDSNFLILVTRFSQKQ
jgi:anti-sigma regulatory factor (Ser/Thr protein kinase)